MKRKIVVEIDCQGRLCNDCHGIDPVGRFCWFFDKKLQERNECAIRLPECLQAEKEAKRG